MLRKPDFFVRKVKYSLPPKRKVRFEFREKKYESTIIYGEKQNFQEFIQSFFNQNHPKLNADNFDLIRNNKTISKGNLVNESCLKETFKIVPFELNREEFHIKNNYPVEILNLGFKLNGDYIEEKNLGGNFFYYLKKKIDPKKYSVEREELKEKEHVIQTSYNTSISNLLEHNFFKKMKDLPNSGYDKMGKFIVGVFDKQFYKQFTASLVSHIVNLNSKNLNNEKLQVDIDYNLKGIYTPEAIVDLLVKKTDDSFMLPITFGRHNNDIKGYKHFLEWYLMTNKEIATVQTEKNDKEIKPSIEKRITKLKKIDLGNILLIYSKIINKKVTNIYINV